MDNQETLNNCLLIAVRQGDVATILDYLKKGATIEAKDADGSTALLLASRYGHTRTVKFLNE